MSHVALVIPGLNRIGGAEQQVILLARGLKQRGWQVSVVALTGSGGEAARELAEAGAQFISLGMRKGLADPRGWLRFHRWLRRSAPDVVHAHLAHASLLARCSRLAAAIPVLVDTVHTSATGTLARRFSYRLSNFLSHRVTAVSEAAAQAHLDARVFSHSRLAVIPNAIEPERWRPDATARRAARRELGIGSEFLWLAAGRLEPVKDYPALLRAMRVVPEPARLIVAGSGAQFSRLTALSAALGVDKRVRFLGFTRDLERWMQAADAFVLCSRWEGLPTALMEASAAGLPAVATDVPGVREVLGPAADSQRLVAPANPAALACAMTRLMRLSGEAREEIGDRARRFANKQFSREAVLDRWESLYQSVLDGRCASSRQSPVTAESAGGSRQVTSPDLSQTEIEEVSGSGHVRRSRGTV